MGRHKKQLNHKKARPVTIHVPVLILRSVASGVPKSALPLVRPMPSTHGSALLRTVAASEGREIEAGRVIPRFSYWPMPMPLADSATHVSICGV